MATKPKIRSKKNCDRRPNWQFYSAFGIALLASLVAVMLLVGVHGSRAASNGESAVRVAEGLAPSPLAGNTSSNSRLRAAAEPFETLTETAFSASPRELEKSLRKAENASQSVQPLLSPRVAQQVADYLSTLRAAARKSDRAAVALASVEIYRELVSSVSGETKVPNSVSLLDYAGFRYDADLKARPARWTDMEQAARFAEKEWQTLEPKVTSPGLSSQVSQAIAGMANAAQNKNKSVAARSSKAELDLVDRLETHFASR